MGVLCCCSAVALPYCCDSGVSFFFKVVRRGRHDMRSISLFWLSASFVVAATYAATGVIFSMCFDMPMSLLMSMSVSMYRYMKPQFLVPTRFVAVGTASSVFE